MSDQPTCASRDCEETAIMAIANRAPRDKEGLITTIYQFEEDAPKNAARYCAPCGIRLAAGIAALSDGSIRATVALT